MLGAIWLQLADRHETPLRALIGELASKHGSVPFHPHLTVCAGELDAASFAIALAYVRRSGLLLLVVRVKGISYSTVAPFRAVVVDVDDSPNLRAFRDGLHEVTHAAAAHPPHISLLYTLDENGLRLGWSSDDKRLKLIADECAARIEASEFVLDRPVIVTPDRDRTNIRSWQVALAL